MNIPLYKAAAQLSDLLDQVDPETGELPEGLDAARLIVEDKAKAVAAYILEERARADSVEAHAKRLIEKAKSVNKRADWLQQYLIDNMLATGIFQILSDDGTYEARLLLDRDVSVEIQNLEKIPPHLLRQVPASFEANKKLISEALKAGTSVPGARLVTSHRFVLK